LKRALIPGLVIALVPFAAQTSEWKSEFGVGLFTSDRTSTDTALVGNPFNGTYVEAMAETEIEGFRFSADARGEFTDDGGANNVYLSGPIHTGVVGFHLGRQYGDSLIGGYAAIGFFDGYDDEGPMRGWTAGVEIERAFERGSIFAQIGYAEAIGDPSDNEFQGPNVRVGYHGSLTNKLYGVTSVEYAYSSDCFEDCSASEWGSYLATNFGLGYDLGNGWEAVGAVRLSAIAANVEDAATDSTLYLGFTRTLGDRPRSELRTPMGAFHAAGWMHPLD